MKKSKIALPALKLKKEAILTLSKGQVYGGDVNTAATCAATCGQATIPANLCQLSRVCETNDMANPRCFDNNTIRNTCQCPAESSPAINCWGTTAACPQTSMC